MLVTPSLVIFVSDEESAIFNSFLIGSVDSVGEELWLVVFDGWIGSSCGFVSLVVFVNVVVVVVDSFK